MADGMRLVVILPAQELPLDQGGVRFVLGRRKANRVAGAMRARPTRFREGESTTERSQHRGTS